MSECIECEKQCGIYQRIHSNCYAKLKASNKALNDALLHDSKCFREIYAGFFPVNTSAEIELIKQVLKDHGYKGESE